MEIGAVCGVESVFACYLSALCVCLMGLWVYELVMNGCARSKNSMQHKRWKACPYCGSIIIHRTPICVPRCPTCQLYLSS